MSNFNDLVPSLELCRKIPAGEFKDSALIWDKTDKIGFWDGVDKEGNQIGGFGKIQARTWRVRQNFSERTRKHMKESEIVLNFFPAPTLQEIMEVLPHDDAYNDLLIGYSEKVDKITGWHIYYNGDRHRHCCDKNPATAALKLWLKLKGIENE